MLAYLDALCTALRTRDAAAIAALLSHPLVSALPPSVLGEAQRIACGDTAEHTAPLHTLRLYHQTAHLLGSATDSATRLRPASPPVLRAAADRSRQMELDLPPAEDRVEVFA